MKKFYTFIFSLITYFWAKLYSLAYFLISLYHCDIDNPNYLHRTDIGIEKQESVTRFVTQLQSKSFMLLVNDVLLLEDTTR